MIKILVITHGNLGKVFIETAESIVGQQQDANYLNLAAEDSLSSLSQRTEEYLQSHQEQDGVLILTDMLGGTPCNACLPLSTKYKVEIISGINLYMLLSAFLNRNSLPLEELAKKVIIDGKKNIINIKEIFMKKLG
jgi:mannose PTS system EIIA component